jgi:prepilin-type N-terminal cleavage/methylation domain-containing protein
MATSTHRAGFALLELLVSLAIVGVLLAVFALGAADARRNSSLGDSIGNLKQFAWAGSAYTADNAERLWTFSWRAGATSPSEYPDLEFSFTDVDAAANQAVDIIRRRADPTMPRMTSWVPHILYSQLVLADHLNLPLPTPWVASPGDATRLGWQQWPNNPVPLPSPGDPSSRRWVYSSSYELGPAFWNRDQRVANQYVVEQASSHNTYTLPSPLFPLGDRLITQVAFPSQKAMVWEMHQRFFGARVAYFGYPEARVPVLTVDGSVLVRATNEANVGFRPNQPESTLNTVYSYLPASFEPPAISGGGIITGRYRWTRAGLAGRDFGGPEACSGQPGCTP